MQRCLLPPNHPIYDPTSSNCIKETSVNTCSVGNCAVLQTTLDATFTDVTFANSAGRALSTADYVVATYTCLQ